MENRQRTISFHSTDLQIHYKSSTNCSASDNMHYIYQQRLKYWKVLNWGWSMQNLDFVRKIVHPIEIKYFMLQTQQTVVIIYLHVQFLHQQTHQSKEMRHTLCTLMLLIPMSSMLDENWQVQIEFKSQMHTLHDLLGFSCCESDE